MCVYVRLTSQGEGVGYNIIIITVLGWYHFALICAQILIGTQWTEANDEGASTTISVQYGAFYNTYTGVHACVCHIFPHPSLTDEKDTETSLANLPDLFSRSHFLLYGAFSPPDRRLVQRYITAYNG